MSASVNFEKFSCISTFCIAVTFTFTNIFTYFFSKSTNDVYKYFRGIFLTNFFPKHIQIETFKE